MYTRKQALSIARQLRTCPPPSVKKKLKQSKEVRRHIDICPFCSTDLKKELDAWLTLSENFNSSFKSMVSTNDQKEIRTGQIRVLKKSLGCWRDDYYYNVPVIAVIDDKSDIDDEVLVAQTWHDIYMASPGDLVLPENLIKGFDELFIETWNIYTLKKEYLGTCLGQVDRKIVKDVLRMNQEPGFLPKGAVKPMPLEKNDPRKYFQELEIETGFTFAVKAVHELMEENTLSIYSNIAEPVDNLIDIMNSRVHGLSWAWPPGTVEECLSTVWFAPESIPLAAAEDDQKEIIAAYITLKDGKIEELKPVACIIHYEKSTADSYSITGVIPGLSSDLPAESFNCYIVNSEAKSLFPGEWSWEGRDKNFLARFDKPLEKHEKISICIIELKKDLSL